MIYFCCDQFRRAAVRGSALNGIDFVEIVDRDAPSPDLRQRILHVHLLNDPGALVLTRDNVRIEGGERIRTIRVDTVTMGLAPQTNVVVVEVDRYGDDSPYTVRLVRSATDDRPPVDFDPMLSEAVFSFKAECPSPFDCKPVCGCSAAREPLPEIDYLAKDYESLLSVMRDRMALLAPDWTERNAADEMVAVLELLAWIGDQISWAQDAAHNEAFLDRCRSRISLRRLARLVDYFIGEGCNARVHVHIAVSADVAPLLPGDPPVVPRGTAIATFLPDAGATVANVFDALARADAVYETLHDVEALFVAHGEMPFYAWSDRRCCLPKGATRATLAGHFPDLRIGETLIFEEIFGPRTGRPADADPAHRQPVKLTAIEAFDGAAPLTDPVTGDRVTWIEWAPEDALSFPLCISSETDPEFGSAFIAVVSVARGNIVLADHGHTFVDEVLGLVPEPAYRLAGHASCNPCDREAPAFAPPRFEPRLALRPVTHAQPFDPTLPAGRALVQDPARALPKVTLTSTPGGERWTAQRDLLASGAFADEFVVEIEADGVAQIRFGDDINGHRPEPGTAFAATYRVGSGRAGAIGADTLRHIALPVPEITRVRNPLASTGGVEPETAASVRARAPYAFRVQERAVTRDDYAEVSQRLAEVQRAAATWIHTGSWLTVFVSADRFGGGPVDDAFAGRLSAFLERFRLAGYDLDVDPPIFVPLEIELCVCLSPGFFRSDVRRRILAVLGSDTAADGTPGIFNPDRQSFGQTVWLSPIIAAVQGVPGVRSVRATVFRRLGDKSDGGLEDEFLTFERLEIAQLDNDPNFPEHGQLRLVISGGL
jgi:hypothetical protein